MPLASDGAPGAVEIPWQSVKITCQRAPGLGASWGELAPGLRCTNFGVRLLWPLLATAIPRESPSHLARLWHGNF